MSQDAQLSQTLTSQLSNSHLSHNSHLSQDHEIEP